MDGYHPRMTFEGAGATTYDGLVGDREEAATIAFLAELAAGRPALELAIGTGRIALPLAEATGSRVDGIDLTPDMVDVLRTKPGGEALAVTIGDMTDAATYDGLGTYDLIYVVFNSFFNVLTQVGQIATFERAAEHLTDGGAFVIEGGATLTFFTQLNAGQYVRSERIRTDAVRFDLLQIDAATQLLWENHVELTAEGASFIPVVQRWAWPAELDLMARIAGLELRERWGGWTKPSFTAASENVISVYGRATG
jgi:SAM-dependent methyltransferase